MEAGALKEFSFPSDIVASYQMRLLLYGALDLFIPSTRTKTRAFSIIIEGAGEGLEITCAKLEEKGWRLGSAEAEGRDIVVAERGGVILGSVISKAEDGLVLTLLLSSEDERVLRDVEEQIRTALSEAFPEAEEVMLKSRDEREERG